MKIIIYNLFNKKKKLKLKNQSKNHNILSKIKKYLKNNKININTLIYIMPLKYAVFKRKSKIKLLKKYI